MVSLKLQLPSWWVTAQLQQKLLCLGFSLTPTKVSVTVYFGRAAYKQKITWDKKQFPYTQAKTLRGVTEQSKTAYLDKTPIVIFVELFNAH